MSSKKAPARAWLGIHVLVCLAVIFLAWEFSLQYGPFARAENECGYDKEVFKYMGMLIATGHAPYRDGFDHKPPMLYFLHAFTHRWDPMGPWVLETALLALSALALYWIALRRRWPLPFLYPAYWVALLRTGDFIAGGGLTRSFGATFAMLFAALALVELPFAALGMGALFACCFFLQQNDAMPLGLLMIFHLTKAKRWKRELAQMAAGAALVTAPILGWFLWKGAFREFVDQAFLFNTRLYVDPHVAGNLWSRLKRTVKDFGLKNWFTVAAVLFVFLPRKIFWNKRILREPLAWITLGMFAEMCFMNIAGVLYQQYFLGLLVWVMLFTGELFRLYALHPEQTVSRRYMYFLLLALLYVLPNPSIGRSFQDYWKLVKADKQPGICGSLIEEFAREVAGQPGQFYSFGNVMYLSLNRHYDIMAPTIWIYTHFWNQLPKEKWDGDRKEFQKIIDGIERYKTKYVYMENTREHPPFLDASLNDAWFRYFYPRYKHVARNVWRRNE